MTRIDKNSVGFSTQNRMRSSYEKEDRQAEKGFDDRLAKSYRLLANDEEALEAAKSVIAVLPFVDAPNQPLRLASGGVVATGCASLEKTRAPKFGQPLVPNNLTLHIKLQGDSVDIIAYSRSEDVRHQIADARKDLEKALKSKGLKLRHLRINDPQDVNEEAKANSDNPLLKRSYMEVIA